MAYATPTADDVWEYVGRDATDPAEMASTQKLIGRAERKLVRVLKQRGAAWEILEDSHGDYLADLVVEAVARVVRNAAARAGYRSENEGNYGYTVENARVASATLWWPDDELELLGLPVVRRRVGSMKVRRPVRDW